MDELRNENETNYLRRAIERNHAKAQTSDKILGKTILKNSSIVTDAMQIWSSLNPDLNHNLKTKRNNNMKNTDIRKSSTIKTHIAKAKKGIRQLEERKNKLDSKIQDIQDSILDLSENEAHKELAALTSTREVTAGAIQDRHQRIETLQQELGKAEEKEQTEDAFNDIVALTKKAHELVEQRNEIHRWANEVLEKKMLEYADNWSQWVATVRRYTELAPSIEPSFSQGFDIPVEDREMRKEKRKKVIEEIEEAANLSTQPLRNDLTGRFLGNTRGMLTAMIPLEEANFNLSKLTQGPQRRRKREQEAKREQPQKDSEAA